MARVGFINNKYFKLMKEDLDMFNEDLHIMYYDWEGHTEYFIVLNFKGHNMYYEIGSRNLQELQNIKNEYKSNL